jgi:hypothetical protein
VILRATANGTFGGNWTRTGGTSVFDALSDQNDATYIRSGGGATGTYECINMPTTGITTEVTINRVIFSGNIRTTVSGAGPEKFNFFIYNNTDGFHEFPGGGVTVSTTLTTYDDQAENATANGSPYTTADWTVTELDRLEVGVVAISIGAGEEIEATDIWVVIDYTDNDPYITSLSPADGNASVPTNNNFVMYFNETVQANSGNVTILNGDTTVFETIDINSANISFSGNQMTINPSTDLNATSNYYIQVDNTAIHDLVSNAYAGINDQTTWNFTSAAGPIQVDNIPRRGVLLMQGTSH